jgi:hypothetical protein
LRGKGLGAGGVPDLYSVKTERENSATHQSDSDCIFRIESAKITTQMRPKNNLLETRPKLATYVHGRCKNTHSIMFFNSLITIGICASFDT